MTPIRTAESVVRVRRSNVDGVEADVGRGTEVGRDDDRRLRTVEARHRVEVDRAGEGHAVGDGWNLHRRVEQQCR